MQKTSTSPGEYYKNAFLSHRVWCCISDGCVRSMSFVICCMMDTRSVIFCRGLLVWIPLSVLIIWQCNWRWRFQFRINQCLESICLVPAFFDDEYIVDPYVVKLRSPTRGTCLDHIWSKFAVWQSPPTRGTCLDHIWSKSAVRQSPPTRGIMFLPHLANVRCVTSSSNEGHHFWLHLA